MNVYFRSEMSDDDRRLELYRGSLFVLPASASALKLCEFAREMVAEAFDPFDPQEVHHHMSVERCVEILSDLKPRFIHHSRSKEYVRGMLAEANCDPEKTYFDVPRLRTSFPSNFLSSGIAYAFHPHRDTWYSAPFSQLNWWLPVRELRPDNCMAFHPRYWTEGVSNSSSDYNYYEWNRTSRKTASQHIGKDRRIQPKALEPVELEPQIRVVPGVGDTILFSAAHMHSSVPNTSDVVRYSIDFRTVNADDARVQAGAPNVDSASTGTTMRDYLRASDLSRFPDPIVRLFDDDSAEDYCASPTAALSAESPSSSHKSAARG